MCFQPELPHHDKGAGETELTFSKHSFVPLGANPVRNSNPKGQEKKLLNKERNQPPRLSDVDPHIRLLTVPSQIVNDSDKLDGLAAARKGPSEDSFVSQQRN